METYNCINNNIDNYAFFLFLFLVSLSVGNDCYYVVQHIQNTDFIKKQSTKYNNYYQLFTNVLCNNVKKVKNGLVTQTKKSKKSNALSNVELKPDNEPPKENIQKKVRKNITKHIEQPPSETSIKKKTKYSNKLIEEI